MMRPEIDQPTKNAIEALIFDWARLIDEDLIEQAAELLLDDGEYKVASRFNADRGLPLAIIHCKSRAQLRDRILSMRVANVYEPHFYRHLLSGVQVLGRDADVFEVRTNYTIIKTIEHDGSMGIFSAGQYRDRIIFTSEGPRFRSRHVLFDSRSIDTLLVIPI